MGEASERARGEFPAFPFDPYPIQTDFMAFLYDSLDKGGIAMLESPTGTPSFLPRHSPLPFPPSLPLSLPVFLLDSKPSSSSEIRMASFLVWTQERGKP